MRQPPWTAEHTIPYRALQDKDKLLEETMGVLQEMKVIPYLEEVLVDHNHLIIKDQKLLDEEGQMDHLMEILEIMDPLVMKDIIQDKGPPGGGRPPGPPGGGPTWKSWASRKSRTSRPPWTMRTQRTSWTTRTYETTRSTWTNH